MRGTLAIARAKRFLSFVAIAIFTLNAYPQDPSRDPTVFAIGREAPRAIGISNLDESAILSLDGLWRFHMGDTPLGAGGATAESTAEWEEVSVPSNWPLLEGGPAQEGQRIGTYFRTFELPSAWDGREVFIHVARAYAAAEIYVNDQRVGYWEGRYAPGEFRVTRFLRPGENNVVIRVYGESDAGAFVVDGIDQTHGIEGSVYAFSTPKTYIRDVSVDTVYTAAHADVSIEAIVRNYDEGAQTRTLRIELMDPDGASAIREPLMQTFVIDGRSETRLEATVRIRDPRSWTAEAPHLYNASISIGQDDGARDACTIPIGIRDVAIDGGRLRVNGKAITIRGVRYYGHSPFTGRAMTMEEMRADVELMKSGNINAVMMLGSPAFPAFLDLCDQFGIYVFDCVALNAPGTENAVEWGAYYEDRARSAGAQNRNHPSVVAWNLGDIDSAGENHRLAVEALDPLPVFSTNGNARWNDFAVAVRPQVDELARIVQDADASRPLIISECGSALGNGLGGFEALLDDVLRSRRIQGGFVASWADRAIANDRLTFVVDRVDPTNRMVVVGEVGALDGRDALVHGYAVIPPDPRFDIFDGDFAIELTVFPSGTATWVSDGGRGVWLGQVSDSAIAFRHGDSNELLVQAPPEWYGRWHDVVVVCVDGSVSIAIDGEVVAEDSFEAVDAIQDAAIHLGIDPQLRVRGESQFGSIVLRANGEPVIDASFENAVEIPSDWLHVTVPAYGDGLVTGDRAIRPTYTTVSHAYAPVDIEPIDVAAGKLRVTNMHDFLSLDALEIHWFLNENGKSIGDGIVAAPAAGPGGASSELWIPFTTPRPKPGATYTLTVAFVLREDRVWAQKGHEVYAETFLVPLPVRDVATSDGWGPLDIDANDEQIAIGGNRFTIVFDRTTGLMSRWVHDDREVVATGPIPNLWRAPVDADRQSAIGETWSAAGLRSLRWITESVVHEALEDDRVDVTTVLRAAVRDDAEFVCQMNYRIYGDGRILVQQTLLPRGDLPSVPKLGMQTILPPEYWRLQWFGLGPYEAYPDRVGGNSLGLHAEDAAIAPLPYAAPQDYGNKHGVHWAALLDDDGFGLAAKFEDTGNVSARPYAEYQLENVRDPVALIPGTVMFFNTDFLVAGVGVKDEDSAGTITMKNYTHRLWLRPVSPGDDLTRW